jgi:putative membrane protein
VAEGLYTESGLITETPVDLTIIALNFIYAVLGVVLMFIAYRVIDKMTPEVNFPEELRKGNVAVGIFVAAIFLSVAIVVAGALN